VPIIPYFLVVGTSLLGVLVWIDANYKTGPSPITTTQVVGLPQPYKPPRRVVEMSASVISEAKVEPKIDAAKATKVAHKKKPHIKVVRSPQPREEVAQYRMNRDLAGL